MKVDDRVPEQAMLTKMTVEEAVSWMVKNYDFEAGQTEAWKPDKFLLAVHKAEHGRWLKLDRDARGKMRVHTSERQAPYKGEMPKAFLLAAFPLTL